MTRLSSPKDFDGKQAGILSRSVCEPARAILFEKHLRPVADPVAAELHYISQVDRAHVVMLIEAGIVPPADARTLLGGIEALRDLDFSPLRKMPAPRGLYLAYEQYLISTLGQNAGGVLHIGRSRNDLTATTVRLQLRGPHDRLVQEGLELAQVFLTNGQRYRDVVMPAYTHHQPAVPITYGHYLLAAAEAVVQEMSMLFGAGEELDGNPLGAGAIGGTSIPIDADRTTELLGFERRLYNSVYAVASRAFVLRILSASAVLGVLLCRLAHDLEAWSTQEAGLVRFADDLVGSSSMMPQKRNPFLLEHVQGRAATSLGGFTAAVAAMSTSRFTNAIAVGTEAVSQAWPGLEATTEAVMLLRLMVEGAEPMPERMNQVASDSFTAATNLAERLATAGIPFRAAHSMVGSLVREAQQSGQSLPDSARKTLLEYGPSIAENLRPADIVLAADFGGGPGNYGFAKEVETISAKLAQLKRDGTRRRQRWDDADAELNRVVKEITGNHSAPVRMNLGGSDV